MSSATEPPHADAVTAPTDGEAERWWVVDGNNVMGARPDGWWNDRVAAARRLTQRIAEWWREHPDDHVVVVFDGPIDDSVRLLAGGRLRVETATRRGRDAADHRIVELVEELVDGSAGVDGHREAALRLVVVTSDQGLADRLPAGVEVVGAGRFRGMVEPER